MERELWEWVQGDIFFVVKIPSVLVGMRVTCTAGYLEYFYDFDQSCRNIGTNFRIDQILVTLSLNSRSMEI